MNQAHIREEFFETLKLKKHLKNEHIRQQSTLVSFLILIGKGVNRNCLVFSTELKDAPLSQISMLLSII